MDDNTNNTDQGTTVDLNEFAQVPDVKEAQHEVSEPDEAQKKTELAEEKALGLPESFQPHGKVDSAFNCKACIGEGITFDVNPEGVICPQCNGTGKV